MDFFDFGTKKGVSYGKRHKGKTVGGIGKTPKVPKPPKAKKIKKAWEFGVTKTKRTAKKAVKPLTRYAPAFGPERTILGGKLSEKQVKALRKEKARGRKKTKKQLKRIWRKLI